MLYRCVRCRTRAFVYRTCLKMALKTRKTGGGSFDASKARSTPSENHLPAIDDLFLVCRVCESDFRSPRLLPCLHSFCSDCLEDSLGRSQIVPGQAFLCPLCRTRCVVPGRGIRDMPANCLATALAEFLRSRTTPEGVGHGGGGECGGCRKSSVAKKCVECGDWLCDKCCDLHLKVKLTKDHHLVTGEELESGKYDEMIKDGLESSLLCGKHGEPLRFFCDEDTCRTSICHLCKMTASHDGHSTVTLADQAATEARRVRDLLPNVDRCIRKTEARLENLAQDEKMTSFVRKRMHRTVIERTEVVIEALIRAVHEYAESLHQRIESAVQSHRDEVSREVADSKNRLDAAKSAKVFAETLVGFNRAEELLTLSDRVCSRLAEFQTPVDTAPPVWDKPRLDTEQVDEADEETAEQYFGSIVFEPDVVKSVMSRTFSARLDTDERACKLCDVAADRDGNIIVADRDNQTVKMFSGDGSLRMVTAKKAFKAPNRVAVLCKSRRIAVKDGRFLRLVSFSGEVVGSLGELLKQPVAVAESDEGEVLVTEWMGGEVVVFDSGGKRVRSFPCDCEAPGYVACSPNGNIIVTDWKRHIVKVFDRRGKVRWEYGEHGSGEGQLDHPYGVCTDQWNNIIVCDTWNNRIHLLSPEGVYVRTLLTKTDGIEWPQAIAVDGTTGQLVIAEQYGTVKFFQYAD